MENNLKLITMRDVETEEISFLWEPYIAFGKLTMLVGDPGDGKTTMMLAIATAVTRGVSLLEGVTPVYSPSNVIFQTAEDGLADTIKPRLEQLGADCDKIHTIDEDEKTLSLTDDRIEQAIIQTGAKLLIIDPIQAYLGGSDMNGAKDVRPIMKKLAETAENTGAAIVLIGHLSKRYGKSKSIYRALGSIDITAAMRSVLLVGRLDVDEHMRAFVQTKSNLAPIGKPQAFGLDPVSGFCWLGECDVTAEELLDGEKKEKQAITQIDLAKSFIAGLMSNGDITANEALARSTEMGYSESTIKRAKSQIAIKSVKRGNEWFWVKETEQEGQAA